MIELFEQKKYDELLSALESLSPTDFRKALVDLVNTEIDKGVDVYETLHDELTGKQWKHFKWLDSSEREKQYILNKDSFSEKDDDDLKSCDF